MQTTGWNTLTQQITIKVRPGTYFAVHYRMRIAIAIWDGRISPVFDVARQIAIFDSDRDPRAPDPAPLALLPGLARVDQLVNLGISTLICGGVSCALHQHIEARGIEVIHNVAGALPEVLASYQAGQLAGCPQRRRGAGRRSSGRGRCQRFNTDHK